MNIEFLATVAMIAPDPARSRAPRMTAKSLPSPPPTSITRSLDELSALLGRLDLLPADVATAELATALGAAYRLRDADAIHLGTAVNAGADRFLTNNQSDFPKSITEINVVYPEELVEPADPD